MKSKSRTRNATKASKKSPQKGSQKKVFAPKMQASRTSSQFAAYDLKHLKPGHLGASEAGSPTESHSSKQQGSRRQDAALGSGNMSLKGPEAKSQNQFKPRFEIFQAMWIDFALPATRLLKSKLTLFQKRHRWAQVNF